MSKDAECKRVNHVIDIVKDWPPFCSESKFRPRSPLHAGMSSRGGSQVRTRIFFAANRELANQVEFNFFQWFYQDNPSTTKTEKKIDFVT